MSRKSQRKRQGRRKKNSQKIKCGKYFIMSKHSRHRRAERGPRVFRKLHPKKSHRSSKKQLHKPNKVYFKCGICKDTLFGKRKFLKCGHFCHKKCYYRVMRSAKPTCPKCKRILGINTRRPRTSNLEIRPDSRVTNSDATAAASAGRRSLVSENSEAPIIDDNDPAPVNRRPIVSQDSPAPIFDANDPAGRQSPFALPDGVDPNSLEAYIAILEYYINQPMPDDRAASENARLNMPVLRIPSSAIVRRFPVLYIPILRCRCPSDTNVEPPQEYRDSTGIIHGRTHPPDSNIESAQDDFESRRQSDEERAVWDDEYLERMIYWIKLIFDGTRRMR